MYICNVPGCCALYNTLVPHRVDPDLVVGLPLMKGITNPDRINQHVPTIKDGDLADAPCPSVIGYLRK